MSKFRPTRVTVTLNGDKQAASSQTLIQNKSFLGFLFLSFKLVIQVKLFMRKQYNSFNIRAVHAVIYTFESWNREEKLFAVSQG